MIERWRHLLSDDEYQGLEQAGYIARGSVSWGRPDLGAQPALIVVDMQTSTTGSRAPLSEAVQEFPIASGRSAVEALSAAVDVVEAARAVDIPVIFTRIVPRGGDTDAPHLALAPELKPAPGDLVIDKYYASAFAGTPLQAELTARGIDSTIVVGISTSGCVRATVVDALQHGFAPIVVPEATADRVQISHEVALMDMWLKYANLIVLDQIPSALRTAVAGKSPAKEV